MSFMNELFTIHSESGDAPRKIFSILSIAGVAAGRRRINKTVNKRGKETGKEETEWRD